MGFVIHKGCIRHHVEGEWTLYSDLESTQEMALSSKIWGTENQVPGIAKNVYEGSVPTLRRASSFIRHRETTTLKFKAQLLG